MQEYTVEFRIYGSEVDASSITRALRLEPCLIRHVGDRKSVTEKWQEALWSYSGFPASAGSKTWQTLEEGLNFLIDRLLPLREEIETFQRQHRVILWCGHFQSNDNETTVLSPVVLRKLGSLGVELFIDHYFSDQ